MLRSRRIGAMRDVELYRTILGLTAPWTVASVDLQVPEQRLVVHVEAGPGPYPCPECGTLTGRYDSKPRRWRHLDTMQFTTWIEADVPRVECATMTKRLMTPHQMISYSAADVGPRRG
jgi:transposase